MTRALPFVLFLLALSPALAQDSRPAGKEAPAALDLIGAALLKARENKVLKTRLLDEHAYYSEARGRPTLLVISGKTDAKGIHIELNIEMITQGNTLVVRYSFDPAGDLRALAIGEERKRGDKLRKELTRGKVEGDELVVTRSRDGEPKGETKRAPWRRDALPSILTVFVAPILADQGLPEKVEGIGFKEFNMGSKRAYRNPVSFSKKGVDKDGTHPYVVYRVETKSDPIEIRTYAEGPLKGQIALVTIDYKSKKPEGFYRRLNAKELKEILASKGMIKNEAMAMSSLGSLNYKQTEAKQRDSRYSDDAAKLNLSDEAYPGYELLLRVSPDGQRWMAVAFPQEKGKTGRLYFATTSDGGLYSSTKEIPLADDCQVPAGLKKVR
jgi:hypothetical protein